MTPTSIAVPVPVNRGPFRVAVAATFLVLALSTTAWAQVGALVSPGPLSKAHAALEGAANCQKCHEPGRQVTAARCLACHQPIARRIAAKKGVHREVTGDCVACHAEHAGRDAELRPFDAADFDHAGETGFPLDGRHAPLARDCAKCHKSRSFLTLSPACSSCHTDAHKGTLGTTCVTCHTTARPFAEARATFNHDRSRFKLLGAHQKLDCSKCHATKASFAGLRFSSCTDCHKEPHRQRLGADCTACHTNDTWKTRKMDHARTAFPLKGKHAAVPCASCHKASPILVRPKSERCADCHTDVHRGQFTQDCSACHNENGFAKGGFDHGRTRFPLTGAHVGLPCARCHKGTAVPASATPKTAVAAGRSVTFAPASSDCASCHNDPHKGQAGPQCGSCHTTTSFRVSAYTHKSLPAAFLTGLHARATCVDCHARGGPRPLSPASRAVTVTTASTQPGATAGPWRFAGLGTACSTCHAEPHGGQFTSSCETCHAIDAPRFAASRFSHAATAFALTGRHQALECARCHRPDGPLPAAPRPAVLKAASPALPAGIVRYKGLGGSCASCHQDVHLGQLGTACATCHTPEGFAVARFEHKGPRFAGFFAGKHAEQTCRACHKPETAQFPGGRGTAVRFVGTGTGCVSCHADRDPHKGSLGSACESCHAPERWGTVSRAFHKDTRFPLDGRHLGVACASCHTNGVTAGTPTTCYDCHWVRRRDDPNETRLGTQCEQCHRTTGWAPVNWNHAAMTGTRLNLAHQLLQCDSCHRGRVFANTRVICSECHLSTFQRTTAPNHVTAGFPTDCEACHRSTDSTWRGATFNHAAAFPLIGVHALQPCASCHRSAVYRGTPRTCVGCHQADYQRTQNPNHAGAGFPTTCETCHRPTDPSWRSGSFSHASIFPLVGVHATQACASCHKNNVYKGTPRDCAGCHLPDYQRAAQPNHVSAGFPTTCESCHRATDSTWRGASFNHNTVFALVGVHATQACGSCHKNNVYKGTPRDCAGCHLPDYQRAAQPNHVSAGFPTTCESCHRATDTSWRGASFNHNTVFPLVGVHATQACATCHKNNVYKGTPRDCVGCHLNKYQQTTQPNHAAAGFPTTCDSCHRASDSTWTGASFNHNAVFPLLGRHAAQPCSACHKNNVYRGTPRECYPCHQVNYANTRNPNHTAAGFPTTCETCHRASDTAWTQGTFNHTWFPITTGRHAGYACSACHTTANDFKVFSCTVCHSRTETDQEHTGNGAYRYDSIACYTCHPTGRS